MLVSNPIICLHQFWLLTVSITSSGNAVTLKPKEYSHNCNRVTPNMCFICRMRYDYLCWLFLVAVDIIRDQLPQVAELSFLCGYCTVSLYRTKWCVRWTIWQKSQSFGVLFMVSRVNTYSKLIWCTETLIPYHMYLFWHGRVWCHRLRHVGRQLISLYIFP